MFKSQPSHSHHLPIIHYIRTRALFPILLPVFFVLHGFIANYSAVNVLDAFLLILLYIIVTIVVAAIGWLVFREVTQAALFAFVLMAYHFFFGVIQDQVIALFPNSILAQYRFIIPVSCLLLLLFVIWLKKRKKMLLPLTAYLNILFLLLILIDASGLVIDRTIKKTSRAIPKEDFTICDTCKKPDVYFILLDQYAGNTGLKESFNFDNAVFASELNKRGFHTAHRSRSNYNLTPFS